MTRLLFFLFLTLALAACTDGDASNPPPPNADADESSVQFRKDGEFSFVRDGAELLTIDIEIAESDSARQRGMMQRTRFPDRSGMLFLFEQQDVQSFWMANTPMSLDLLFIGRDSQIVDIARYAEPLSPDPITSAAPARFVLEVPAGFVDTYGVIETDRVRWTRTGAE